jgi:hypothetical protein
MLSQAQMSAYQDWRAAIQHLDETQRPHLVARQHILAVEPDACVRDGELEDVEMALAELDDLLGRTAEDSRLYWDNDLILACPRGCQTYRPSLRNGFGWPLLSDCGACGSPMHPADGE